MSVRERLNLIIDKMTEEQMEALIVILNHDEQPAKKASIDDIAGRLHKYANPEFISLEKDAWANAVVENYIEEMRVCREMRVIDANIILRIILRDNDELFTRARSIVYAEKCIIFNEIAAEVVYVLNKVYKIDRKELAEAVLEILNAENINPAEPEVLKAALKIYGENSLDFADCILIGYHVVYGYEIKTFDIKLNIALERLK